MGSRSGRPDKFTGCLFGAAIGDALGMPAAGLTRAEIARLGAISDFGPARSAASLTIPLTALGEAEICELLRAGQWTDDTQLLLALAETLVQEAGMFVPDAWAYRLVRWLNDGPRAPDLSSLEAAVSLRTGGAEWDDAADSEGAGSGAASRAASIALAFPTEGRLRANAARLQAAVTHGSSDAQGAAVAVAEAVAAVLPVTPEELSFWSGEIFLDKIIGILRFESHRFAEIARCLEIALSLLQENIDAETAVRVIGVSEWSREAVPAALYLAARFPVNFETLMLNAVNLTGGAVDSIACIAGAVGGALHGAHSIPPRWRREVEDPGRILEAALGLYRLTGFGETGSE